MRPKLRRISTRIRRNAKFWLGSFQTIPLMLLVFLFLALTFFGYQIWLNNGDFDQSAAESFFRLALPFANGKPEGGENFSLRSLVYSLTNYDFQDPLTILEGVIPVTPRLSDQHRVWEERPFVFIPGLSFAPDPVRPIPSQPSQERQVTENVQPKVLIYHTHTSEMYLGRAVAASQSAEAHYMFRNLADPTITGVMTVGRHLSTALTSLGYPTWHETRIHTLPSINHSYSNSEKTVREILNKHKDFELVLDLHRDAGVPSPAININGRSVARLALVVGTAENTPLAHPNFQKNLDFAFRIKSVCDEMYPGLMRPVQVQKEARYNQHLHPRSLIIELGSVENTLDEALLAAELLANVLVRVL